MKTVLRRGIRSYCAGRGRITKAQKRAFEEWGARFLMEPSATVADWETVFGRRAPLVLEVGSGSGEATAAIAEQTPDCDCVVLETYKPGIGMLMNALAAREIHNVRIVCADCAEYMPRMFAENSLAVVRVFFPDPWPKRRHHKRRLINEEFAAEIARVLAKGGIAHFATDDEGYAAEIARVAEGGFFARAAEKQFAAQKTMRETTPSRFALRAAAAGRKTKDLIYERI